MYPLAAFSAATVCSASLAVPSALMNTRADLPSLASNSSLTLASPMRGSASSPSSSALISSRSASASRSFRCFAPRFSMAQITRCGTDDFTETKNQMRRRQCNAALFCAPELGIQISAHVAQAGIDHDGHHGLAPPQPFRDLNRSDRIRARGRAGEQALFAGQPPRHGLGGLGRDRQKLIDFAWLP